MCVVQCNLSRTVHVGMILYSTSLREAYYVQGIIRTFTSRFVHIDRILARIRGRMSTLEKVTNVRVCLQALSRVDI